MLHSPASPTDNRPPAAIWHRAVTFLCVLVAGAALAACSSNADKPQSTSTSVAKTSTSASTMPSAAQSKSDIDHAYSVLFDLASPAVAPKLAVVQDGQLLKSAFATALKSRLAKLAGGANVTRVTLETGSACTSEVLTTPCAKVTYNIISPKNKIVLANADGLAVYDGGHWLVAKVTICGLMALEDNGQEPTGC